MRIWQWLSQIPATQKDLVFKEGIRSSDEQIIAYLLSYMESQTTKISDIEVMIKELLREVEKSDKLAIKSLVHEALGRIFFERGLYSAAFYQFEEALRNLKLAYEKEGREEDEAIAKLHTWVGLCALRVNEFKRAAEAFGRAIDILEEKISPTASVLGELHALRADSLSFFAPNDALEEFETAHELLLRNPSPLFISNAMKLFAALSFRKNFEEAVSFLNDLSNNILSSIREMNIGIYESFRKVIRNTYLKALRIIRVEKPSSIERLLLGADTVKGLYFIFRSFLKPSISFRELGSINTAILAASELGNIKVYENLMSRKEYLTRLWDYMRLSSYKLRMVNSRALEHNLAKLKTEYRDILVISFIKLLESHEYLLITHAFSHKEFSSLTRLSIDDRYLDLKYEKPEEIANELSLLLPDKFLEKLNYLTSDWLVILSLDGFLHEIPWELISINSSEKPFLSLRCPVVRVASLQQVSTWQLFSQKSDNVALLEVSPDRVSEGKLVGKLLKARGYRTYMNIGDNVSVILTENLNVLYYSWEPVTTPDDQPIIRLGSLILMPQDIERLDLSGGLAILNINNGVRVIEDSQGLHSLPLAFNMAGFQSVITTIGNVDYDVRSRVIETLLADLKMRNISDRLLITRRMLYQDNNQDWYKYVLYGSPTVIL
ncbi:MAG: hypothetical protein ACTSX9_09790 [Candidatus Njordarchaeales archaeon]